jgi:putative transposase
MAKDSRKVSSEEAIRAEETTTLETLIRRRARGLIDAIVEEELEAALGAAESARVGAARQGYRHGTRERTLTTSLGPTTFAMPRARVRTAEGATVEWRSELVPRYQRRSERVDEAILGVYLSGTNSRRIKGALAPLLRGGPLSKDAVSRLVGRLADDFETWRRRDLAEDQIQYLVMDGWYPKVRIGKRRVRVPVLVTLGVRADGQRVVLDLRLAGDESTAAWRDVIRGLIERHVGTPALAMVDGSAGLAAALREQWPTLAVQRCTAHKLRNLEAKAPVRLREELAEDYRRDDLRREPDRRGTGAHQIREEVAPSLSSRRGVLGRGRR